MGEATIDEQGESLSWAAVRVRGPEAAGYLQGQLTQDVERLEGSARSLLLTPESVVVTSLVVSPIAGGFDLVVPRGLAEATVARLERFKLRSKVDFEVLDVERGPFVRLAERVQAAWPGEEEFAHALTPHVFGRSFVDATISFTKGCFTGQELVGRLDARGASVPWRFVRASGPTRALVEEVLRSKGPATGPQGMTSVVARGDEVEGLGFAHRTLFASATVLQEGGVRVEVVG